MSRASCFSGSGGMVWHIRLVVSKHDARTNLSMLYCSTQYDRIGWRKIWLEIALGELREDRLKHLATVRCGFFYAIGADQLQQFWPMTGLVIEVVAFGTV